MKPQSNEERFVNLINQLATMFNIPKLYEQDKLAWSTSEGVFINARLIKDLDYDNVCRHLAQQALEYIKIDLPMTLEDLLWIVHDGSRKKETVHTGGDVEVP